MGASKRRRNIIAVVVGVLLLVAVSGALAAPAIFKAMGLHPSYEGQRFSFPGGRALIISTSHGQLGEGGRDTGLLLSELTAPYYEFTDAGMQVDVASIEGGEIPVDPYSLRRAIRSEYEDRYDEDPVLQALIQNSLLIDDVNFTEYDIIFLAGGWGAAYDFAQSEVLGDKITEAYAADAVIGGVCHGLLGLLQATDEDGNPLVEGRRITAVTDKQVQELGIEITPQHPERELRAAGADFHGETAFRDFFASNVEVDGRIVSGQNQNDGAEVAHVMMQVAGGSRI